LLPASVPVTSKTAARRRKILAVGCPVRYLFSFFKFISSLFISFLKRKNNPAKPDYSYNGSKNSVAGFFPPGKREMVEGGGSSKYMGSIGRLFEKTAGFGGKSSTGLELELELY
jgi:hypothetical protein